MRLILKTRLFSRWMRKTALHDGVLRKAVDEMAQGLVDADLGGGVYKKRIALPGKGKRGGVRTIIATNMSNRWIFIFGFEKNDKENVTQAELAYLKGIARDLLDGSESVLRKAVDAGELQEICHESDY